MHKSIYILVLYIERKMKFEAFFKQIGNLIFSKFPTFLFKDTLNVIMTFIAIISTFFEKLFAFFKSFVTFIKDFFGIIMEFFQIIGDLFTK